MIDNTFETIPDTEATDQGSAELLALAVGNDYQCIFSQLEGHLYFMKHQIEPSDSLIDQVEQINNFISLGRAIVSDLMSFGKGIDQAARA